MKNNLDFISNPSRSNNCLALLFIVCCFEYNELGFAQDSKLAHLGCKSCVLDRENFDPFLALKYDSYGQPDRKIFIVSLTTSLKVKG